MQRLSVSKVRLVVVASVLAIVAACSGGSDAVPTSSSSGATVATGASEAPVSGGPCPTPDVRTDVAGVEHICMLGTGKTLVWTVDGSNNPGSGPEAQSGLASSDEIPAVIENWGFDLQPYDPATGMAGVMRIDGVTTPPPDPNDKMDSRYLFIDYGDGTQSTDLQMAFFLPLGTPVISMITGTVCDVPKLYSGDYSVRVAPPGVECKRAGQAFVMFETEHVIDPLVKVGDSVVAGQQVATVSDYRGNWKPLGFGIVEIGVAFNKGGDGSPWHACPARYLAPDKAGSLTAALASIHAAWEAEIGDTTLYDEAAQSPLGCTTLDDFNG